MLGIDSDYEVVRRAERDLFKRRKTINARVNTTPARVAMRMAA